MCYYGNMETNYGIVTNSILNRKRFNSGSIHMTNRDEKEHFLRRDQENTQKGKDSQEHELTNDTQDNRETEPEQDSKWSRLILIASVGILILLSGILGAFWFIDNRQDGTTAGNGPDTKEISPASPTDDVNTRGKKIVPPEEGGIYIGVQGDERVLSQLEQAGGRKAAIFSPFTGVVSGVENPDSHALNFNVKRARELWDKGYVFIVSAYETSPKYGSFTIDKLLRGEYDADLRRIAGQFKQFGKPMFFNTAREPNGLLSQYFGGFGSQGDKTLKWAVQNGVGFADFTPPKAPSGAPGLYDGLGDGQVCDGVERLAAAQRYYHDFFTRREGIDFLTFDTMGWLVPVAVGDDIAAQSTLEQNCKDFSQFHSLIANYSDWVTLDWYPRHASDMQPLARMMKEIRKAAPDKPVMTTETGFCGSDQKGQLENGLAAILKNYPELHALQFVAGDFFTDEDVPGGAPTSCRIRPNTSVGDSFKQILAENADVFHSCAQFSGGITIQNCDPQKLTPVPIGEDPPRGENDSDGSTDGSAPSNTCVQECTANGEPLSECQAHCARE